MHPLRAQLDVRGVLGRDRDTIVLLRVVGDETGWRARARCSSTIRACATLNSNVRSPVTPPVTVPMRGSTAMNTSLVVASGSATPLARRYPASAGAKAV